MGAVGIGSAWIVRANEDFPRFTTCYVSSKPEELE
jgi:hypothetical protein